MIEQLNAYKADVTIPVYGTIADAEVYLKKDVDKAIAELEDKALQYKVLDKEHCRDLITQEKFFANQIAHHKYKRCLAMVKYCDMGLTCYNEKLDRFSCERADFFYRWYNHWWKLAEKYREKFHWMSDSAMTTQRALLRLRIGFARLARDVFRDKDLMKDAKFWDKVRHTFIFRLNRFNKNLGGK